MSLIDKTLKKLKKTQQLAFFYRSHVVKENLCGFLIDYNEYCLCVHQVNMEGVSEGLVIFQRPQVKRIRWGTAELESVFALYSKKKRKEKLPVIRIDSTRNALEDVQKTCGYISVYVDDQDREVLLIGEIKALDDEHVHIHEFAAKDYYDRNELILSLEDLISIQAGGVYEEDIRFLNKEFWIKPRKPKKT